MQFQKKILLEKEQFSLLHKAYKIGHTVAVTQLIQSGLKSAAMFIEYALHWVAATVMVGLCMSSFVYAMTQGQ